MPIGISTKSKSRKTSLELSLLSSSSIESIPSKKRGPKMFLNLSNNNNMVEEKVLLPTSVSSSTSTIKSSPESDSIIKSLLKQFKTLELDLNKFNSRRYNNGKNSGVLKSNILRTSLLPFLRKNSNYLNRYFDRTSKVFKSLISVIIAILLKWWSSLVGNLSSVSPAPPTVPTTGTPTRTSSTSSTSSFNDPTTIHYSVVPASDRNAYLECISRIVARQDWVGIDEDFYAQYQVLLTTTLDYCLDKMSTMKTLSLSMSAFIGKIFAYSFFRLEDVANALLFLLNVKQSMFSSTMKILLPSQDSTVLYTAFPSHLHFLIGFRGLNIKSRKKALFLNCVPPPKHPVNGIKDPNAGWVRRWSNCDSNVFNSFLRHYIDILQKTIAPHINVPQTLAPLPSLPDTSRDALMASLPGFNIILSHILQIFQVSVNRISTTSYNKFNVSPSPQKKSSPPPQPSQLLQQKKNGLHASAPSPPPPPPPAPLANNFNMKQCDIYYNSIIKVFRTVRDVVNCSIIDSEDKQLDLLTSNLVRFVDQALISIALETSVYQCNKNGLLLNIASEYINHIHNNLEIPGTLIDWEFWLSCNYMMVKNTDHIQILLKNFAFLFNIWDMIPECLSKHRNDDLSINYKGWLVDLDQSYKANFINWIIGNEMFERFVVHWNPIIRSYYLRLLIWRVIGVNNSQSSTMIQITRRVQQKLNKSYEILHNFTIDSSSPAALYHLNYKPDNPLVNRKFGVLPAGPKEDGLSVTDDRLEIMPATTPISKTSDLRKTHSYEVFDEAIYTCSSLPLGSGSSSMSPTPPPMEQPMPKQAPKSLVSSLGKFFKYLSTDDDDNVVENQDSPSPPPILFHSNKSLALNKKSRIKRNSVSLSSLSTAYSSMKSRSSSPSLLSFNSLPLTDSTSSSVQSDLDSFSESISTLDNKYGRGLHNFVKQLAELSRLPPDIIRPLYKFDIIIDHVSMNEKFLLINYQNSLIGSPISSVSKTERQVLYFPMRPRVPLLSIYISSDPFNNIYINDEDGLYIENLRDDESSDGEVGSDAESLNLFKDALHSKNSVVVMTNLGRSLNELNAMIDEFKSFLNKKIEVDQYNRDLTVAENLNEFDYFKKIIPFLSVDSSNELKLLNAN